MTLSKSILLTVLAFVVGFSTLSHAETAAPVAKLPFSEDQRAAMEDFVRNFILDNPEVLMESVNRFQKSQEKKKEEGALSVLKENMSYINNGKHPEIGNPKGDILIVEFFDYNCGYCKHAMEAVRKLQESDKNVRIVFMDYPILSPQSALAAQWAIAANKQGKYWEFHQALLSSSAPKDEENLSSIGKSVGLDVAKLKKDAESEEVKSYLADVKAFGEKLQVTGTPAFTVGSQIIRGYIEFEAFKTIIAEERKKAKE